MTADVIVTINGQPVVLVAETVRKGRDGRLRVEADRA